MRVALASLFQESHSFSPVPGSWEHFGPREVLRGAALLAERAGTQTELGGAIAVAQAQGVTLVPLLSAMSVASAGPLDRDVFLALRDEIVARLERAGPLDGLLVVLHGGLVAEGFADASGELLRACRAAVPPGLPIVATLDLHANVTRHLVDQVDALAGYHTFPHIDLYETGQRGMRLLLAILSGTVRPATALRRLPMLLPGENGRTTDGPYAEVMALAVDLMQQPGLLDVSVFSVQPWLDVPDIGCSVVVVADGDQARAEREADRLAEAFWERRTAFAVTLTPVAEALGRALGSDQRPFILSDSADSPSSGAPGDSPAVLRALLERAPAKPCFLNIVDAPAVQAMAAAGIGQEVTVQVGARFAPVFYRPLEVTGRVRLLSDGAFRNKGQGFQGVTFYRGLTGVLQIGPVALVVMERPVFQWDPELYRSLGLEPCDAQVVVVKSPTAFRAAYGPFAAEIILLDVPGVCSPNLMSFPFRHVRRPLYPLDDGFNWRAV